MGRTHPDQIQWGLSGVRRFEAAGWPRSSAGLRGRRGIGRSSNLVGFNHNEEG